mmetsp:Transcript_17264/g.38217  ORF Transcript_17264/g.38217 Transcript_17264/m.38217 type:complete len:250 (+) Transcript_17264:476-1225(+)
MRAFSAKTHCVKRHCINRSADLRCSAKLFRPGVPPSHGVLRISPGSLNFHRLMRQHSLCHIDDGQKFGKLRKHALLLGAASAQNSTTQIRICKVGLQVLLPAKAMNRDAIFHQFHRAKTQIRIWKLRTTKCLSCDGEVLIQNLITQPRCLSKENEYSHQDKVLGFPSLRVILPKLGKVEARHITIPRISCTFRPPSVQYTEESRSQDLQALSSRKLEPRRCFLPRLRLMKLRRIPDGAKICRQQDLCSL